VDEIIGLEHAGAPAGTWQSAEEQPLAEPIQQILKLSEQKFEEAFSQAISQLESETSK
jgi:hypothetical protein